MIDFRGDENTHKAKMTFTDDSEFTFNIWNGTPQRPKPVIDMFRRLGSGRQRIQNLGFQAENSVSMGIIADANRAEVEALHDKVGLRFTLTLYGEETYEEVILLGVRISFNESDYGGQGTTIAQCTLTYLVDGEAE